MLYSSILLLLLFCLKILSRLFGIIIFMAVLNEITRATILRFFYKKKKKK